MCENPYQSPKSKTRVFPAWRTSDKTLSAYAKIVIFIQCVSVFTCAPYIVFYRYHGETLQHALRVLPWVIILGFVACFIPVVILTLVISLIASQVRRHHLPKWTAYITAALTAALGFILITSCTNRPIPDLLMYFSPQTHVSRPGLDVSELPIFATCIAVTEMGVWIHFKEKEQGHAM